jgi:hypothetical protein
VQQHILQMEVLNDHVRHLPTLKDSAKAVLITKKGNIPFGEADLAAIVLASVQCHGRTSTTSTTQQFPSQLVRCYRTLRLSSESWLRSRTRSSRQKVRLVQPDPRPRVTQSARRLRARLVESLRRVAVRSFASVAMPMVVPTIPTTPWTAVAMTAMVSPSRQQQVSPLSLRSPTRSLGAIRAWP